MNTRKAETLVIPRLPADVGDEPVISPVALEKHGTVVVIGCANWPAFPDGPSTRLFLAHSGSHLWLHYRVNGDYYRAAAAEDQGPVWEDSCVEFFMTPAHLHADFADPALVVYRNFEFNPNGVCYSANGTKTERNLLSALDLTSVRRFPGGLSGGELAEGTPFDWELTVAIPLTLLGIQPGSTFRANFYKCGDLTAQPHFLSWTPIGAPEPDFHLPGYFGEAELAL